jgi:hypothetical protein
LMVKIKIQMAKAMNGLKRLKAPSPMSPVDGTQTKVANRHEKMAPRTANCKYTQNMGLPGVPPTGSFLSSSESTVHCGGKSELIPSTRAFAV